MAAHGLTIMRQCLAIVSNETKTPGEIVSFVNSALSAPGTCCSVGFSQDSWEAVDRACYDLQLGTALARQELRLRIEAAAEQHKWMGAYPSMDAIKEAIRLYVRIGTPYYKARWARFDAGDAETHKKAHAMIVPTYGNRTAPVIPVSG